MADLSLIKGLTDCSPEDADYYQENLDRLDQHFAGLIESKQLQCASYLLARRGKVFAHTYMGPQTPDKDSPAYGPDSIRRIASMTKMFTSVAILQLMEQGKINPFDSISMYIPQFDTDQHRKVNFIHLLTHTSGVVQPDIGCMLEPYPLPWMKRDEETPPPIEEYIKHYLQGFPLREPGKEWIYCTAGFIILADIVRRISGLSYTDYVEQHILQPLGMKDSGFYLSDGLKARHCRTQGEKAWGFSSPPKEEYRCFKGGGGLYSTLPDMGRFGKMLLNGGSFDGKVILRPQTMKQLQINQLKGVPCNSWGSKEKDIPYGLGFTLTKGGLTTAGCFGHEGAGRSRLLVDPKEELMAVFFVPTSVDWVPQSIVTPPQLIWAGLK